MNTLKKYIKIWSLLFAISFMANISQVVVPQIIKQSLKEEQNIAQLQCIEEGIPIDGPALALPENLAKGE